MSFVDKLAKSVVKRIHEYETLSGKKLYSLPDGELDVAEDAPEIFDISTLVDEYEESDDDDDDDDDDSESKENQFIDDKN